MATGDTQYSLFEAAEPIPVEAVRTSPPSAANPPPIV